MTIATILVILALVAFLCATFGVGARVNLVALGLALLSAAALLGARVLV